MGRAVGVGVNVGTGVEVAAPGATAAVGGAVADGWLVAVGLADGSPVGSRADVAVGLSPTKSRTVSKPAHPSRPHVMTRATAMTASTSFMGRLILRMSRMGSCRAAPAPPDFLPA